MANKKKQNGEDDCDADKDRGKTSGRTAEIIEKRMKDGKKMKKRRMLLIPAIVLVVCVLVTVMPTPRAKAEGGAVTLGTGSIVPGNKVWFGYFLWRVLRNEDGKAMLVTDQTIMRIRFNLDRTAEYAGSWSKSYAREWCEWFYTNAFDGVEKEVILPTSNLEVFFRTSEESTMGFWSAMTDDHVFFLSAEEASTLFADNEDRQATGVDSFWWLRSTIGSIEKIDYRYAGVVFPSGRVLYGFVDGVESEDFFPAARPALNLDLNAVLFSSEMPSDSNQYKMTLLDSNMGIGVGSDGVSRYGNTITVPFNITESNAANATKVSVLITDSAWSAGTAAAEGFTFLDLDVKDFGTTATGTFTLPDAYAEKICGTDYFAYILAVDENAEHASDYASAPVQISIPAPHVHSWTYTADGASITAKCGDDCPFGYDTNGFTLTLNAAEDLIYDGNAKAATITGYPETAPSGLADGTASVTYYPSAGMGSTAVSGSALVGAPSDAGDYVAEMTWGGETARLAFSVTGLPMTVSAPDVEVPYDGLPHGISVSVTVPGSGYAVKYGTAEGAYDQAVSPAITDVSDSPMTVWYEVTANNYLPFTGSATVTISKAANPAFVYTEAEVASGGYTLDLSGNVELNGATGEISYAISGDANGCTLEGSMLTTGTDTVAGTVVITVTVAEDPNHLAMDAKTITVTVMDNEPAGNLTWSGDEHSFFEYIWIDSEGDGAWGEGRNVIPGQTIRMIWNCEPGYIADTFTVTTENGEPVDWSFGLDADSRRVIRFVMPDEAVHVAMTSCVFSFDRADFILPADTLAVEQSAFEGDKQVTVAIIPDHCASIGKWAFRDCKNLQYIRIPAGCSIGEDAFNGCMWVYVYGTEGSPAWQYCRDHSNCEFVADAMRE